MSKNIPQAIDVIQENIAILDDTGCILRVNKYWREFAQANGGDPERLCEGVNYLDVCDKAAASGNADAQTVASMLRSVAAGETSCATMEYPCPSPTQARWFKLKISRLDGDGVIELLVAHENVTEHKNARTHIHFQDRLLESVEQSVIATELDGTINYWNPYAEKMFGWTAAEAIGHNIMELTPSDTTKKVALEVMQRLKKGESWSGESLICDRRGRVFPVHVTDSPIRDEQGNLVGIIGIAIDISARKEAQKALKLSSMVYQALGEAIVVLEKDEKIIATNPAFTSLTGYGDQEAIGQSIEALLLPNDEKSFFNRIRPFLERTGHWQGKIHSRHKNGKTYVEWLRIDTIYTKSGFVKYRIGMFSAISDQKLAEETIWHQANFDFLTGLPNRSMFHDRLEQEVKKAARAGLPLALMFVDLDHFKEVNDAFGHDMGDMLLKDAAQRMMGCIRQTDTVARMGGDEFTIILSGLVDVESIERVVEQLLASLQQPFRIGAETVYSSGTIGITLYPEDATDVDVLLKNADQAMYAAKAQGRNRYCYFTASMQQASQARMRLINDLHHAVDSHEFRLVYQPIVELSTGIIRKAEALLRWQHPLRGIVHPSEFIPLTEETGLLHEIGDWVFEEALQQAAQWRKTIDPEFQISVNMSPVQFRNPEKKNSQWRQYVAQGKQNHATQPKEIIIEITEGLLLEVSDSVTGQLLAFHEGGIEVSIDDFGTGYSALSYLKKFHIDYLKIDQSFVCKMEADSEDLALCEAIVVMGHKLGIKIIAEGVETPEQRELLTKAGCDYAQGYLFCMPSTAEDLEKFLQDGGTSRLNKKDYLVRT